MELPDKTIGFALTGSFCTFSRVIEQAKYMVEAGASIIPIFSENAQSIDTRFGKAEDFVKQMEDITGNKAILTINDAEPIGTKNYLDALLIAPCTGNTLGKLANGITDTTVTMAAKANLRNQKPLVIAISTNDGMGANGKNIGALMNVQNIYFVPFGQDAPQSKVNSLVADMTLISDTMRLALERKQIEPVLK